MVQKNKREADDGDRPRDPQLGKLGDLRLDTRLSRPARHSPTLKRPGC